MSRQGVSCQQSVIIIITIIQEMQLTVLYNEEMTCTKSFR